jgi:hypothetical protein
LVLDVNFSLAFSGSYSQFFLCFLKMKYKLTTLSLGLCSPCNDSETFLKRTWSYEFSLLRFPYIHQDGETHGMFCFWQSWGVEFRALHLLGRHSITWFTLSAPFAFFVCVYGGRRLGIELRAYLSHSGSPFLWWAFFEIGSLELFVQLALNHDLPDLCLLSS